MKNSLKYLLIALPITLISPFAGAMDFTQEDLDLQLALQLSQQPTEFFEDQLPTQNAIEGEIAEAIRLSEIAQQEEQQLRDAIALSMNSDSEKKRKAESPKTVSSDEDEVRAPIKPIQEKIANTPAESDDAILRRYNDPAAMGLDPELALARYQAEHLEQMPTSPKSTSPKNDTKLADEKLDEFDPFFDEDDYIQDEDYETDQDDESADEAELAPQPTVEQPQAEQQEVKPLTLQELREARLKAFDKK